MSFGRFILISSLVVVAFDALASGASIALRFSYQYASIGSALIYIALAFVASRKFGFWRGVLLGAMLGCVDATFGWAVSWVIGPGSMPPGQLTIGAWVFTLAMVVGLGTLCGFIGAGTGSVIRRSSGAA